MADQFNDNIPAVTNQITEDIADIAETLGYIKDVFQAFVNLWDNSTATNIKPKVVGDADNDTLVQCEETADEDIIRFDIGGTEKATLTATGFTVLGVAQGNDVTAALHRKILEIGDWNMDATGSVVIAHGVTAGKIRTISVLIRLDASDSVLPLNYAGQDATDGSQGSWYASSTNAILYRKAAGHFDSTSYNATSYNRGWIIIDYVD